MLIRWLIFNVFYTSGSDLGNFIRIFQIFSVEIIVILLQLKLSLETKGGPVQSLVLDDVTKFGSIDLISGDSKGTVTIFCNGQILNRQSVSGYSINCLQVDKNASK